MLIYSLGYADENDVEDTDTKNDATYPTGCLDKGYKFKLKTVNLMPGENTQTMYFFYNVRNEPISLYQMLKEDSTRSLYLNHTIEPHQWSVLAISEPKMRFICTIPSKEDDYGSIVDCASSLKVCQNVDVRFGLNNKGNFWLHGSNTKNGALRQVVNYGIIP